MNKARRKALAEMTTQLEDIISQLEDFAIGDLKDEEQDYFDNMPESLQGGEKGDAAQTALDAMEAVADHVDTALDALRSAVESLGDASGEA